ARSACPLPVARALEVDMHSTATPAAAAHALAGAGRRLGLEPRDVRTLALMGALVGVLMCAYTIAKVLRDALFLSEYGAFSLPYAYIAVAVASVGFVWLESRTALRLAG